VIIFQWDFRKHSTDLFFLSVGLPGSDIALIVSLGSYSSQSTPHVKSISMMPSVC